MASKFKIWVHIEEHRDDGEIDVHITEPENVDEEFDNFTDAKITQIHMADVGNMLAENPKYLDDSGHCPRCGSEDIHGDTPEPEGDDIYHNVQCANCQASWTDRYRLVGCDFVEETE